MTTRFGPPLDVRKLFGPERKELLDLLVEFDEPQWRAPTACPGWSVKDVAAHILGDDLGRLARTRDGHTETRPAPGEGLPAFIDRINEEWVTAARRLSPALVIAALEWSGQQVGLLWRGLDPDEPSEPVTWAGPEVAPVWLDAARDFSEYWTHHQQIREAVGASPLLDPEYVGPVVDVFMRALPYTLRACERPTGTSLRVVVDGLGGGSWTVRSTASGWELTGVDQAPLTEVRLDVDTVWRLCTRGIDPATAHDRAGISGDVALGRQALQILSIIRAG